MVLGDCGSTGEISIWFEPIAENGTPMCEGISYAKRIVEKWIVSHMESYPPVVINVTDGESTDGNPLSNAKDIAQLKTNDGIFFS